MENHEPSRSDQASVTPPTRRVTPGSWADGLAADEVHRRVDLSRRLQQALGPRYAICDGWRSYRCTEPEQAAVVAHLRSYVADFDEHRRHGNGIVLSGPSGTGKDHLLCLTGVGVCLNYGVEVRWVNGLALWQRFRDAIRDGEYERELVREYTQPGVQIISDPLPPSGSLTEYQASQLYTILDIRYRFLRPTWVSLNVSGRKEAEDRIGAATIDRLRHGALCLACNWPSYRRPKG